MATGRLPSGQSQIIINHPTVARRSAPSSIMRFVRNLLIFLGVFLILLLLGIGLLLTQVDLDRFRGEISQRITEATGRSCEIRGPIQRDGILAPKITMNDIRFGSVAGASEADMLVIDRAHADVDLVSLLKGALDFQSLRLDGVRLVFERGTDDIPNWRFAKRDKNRDRAWFAPALLINRVELTNFEFVRKLRKGRQFAISLDTASMGYDAMVDQMTLMAAGRIGEAPTQAEGTVSNVRALFDGERAPATFDLMSENAIGYMEGYIVSPATGAPSSFALQLDNASTATVGRMLNLPMPVIEQVKGTGTLEILRSDVALYDAKLESAQADFKGRVQGQVADFKRLAKIDLELNLDDGGLVEVFPVLARYVPPGIRVGGTAGFTGDFRNLRADDVDATFSYEDIGLNAVGFVENVRWGTGIDLDTVASAGNLASVGELLSKVLPNVTLPAVGPLTGSGRLTGEYRSLGISGVDISLDDPRVNGSISGRIGDLVAPSGVSLALDLASDEFDFLEQWWNVRFPGPGKIQAVGTLTESGDDWLLTLDRGTLRSADLLVDVNGTVGDLATLSGIDMGIDANVDVLSSLDGLVARTLPPLSNGFLSGRLSGSQDDMSLNVDLLSIEDQRLQLKGSGQVLQLGSDSELDLMLQATSEQSQELGLLFEKELPDLGKVSVNGHLKRKQRRYRLDQIEATSEKGGFIASANGVIDDLAELSGIELSVGASATDVANIPVPVASIPNEFGPIQLSAVLTGNAESLTATDVSVSVRQDELSIEFGGDFVDTKNPTAGEYQLQLAVDSLSRLNELTGRELPDIGPVQLRASVAGDETAWQVRDLEIDISDPTVSASIGGKVDDVSTFDGTDLAVTLETGSFADLSKQLGLEIDLDIPLKGTMRLKQQQASEIAVTDLNLSLDGSTVTGELLFAGFSSDDASTVRHISGAVRSDLLDLKPFLAEPMTQKDAQRDEEKTVFSVEPLKLKALHDYELDIDVAVGALETHKFFITDIDTNLNLADSVLRLGQDNIGVLGGIMDLDLHLDASIPLPELKLKMVASGVDPAKMPSKKLASIVKYGFVNLTLDLDGAGESIAQIMGAANGEVELEFFNLLVDAKALELVGSDIGLQVLRAVNPFLEKEDSVEFECGLFQADIQEGMLTARNTVAAQSKRIALVGGGVADLATEQLEFVVTPKPRKGIGISASNLARIVRIGGTLGGPRLEVDPRGVLQSGAKVGAAIYTGGLTILAEGLLNRLRGLDNVCEGVRTELKIRAGEIERVDPVDDVIDKQ